MRGLDDILVTGAGWITEKELADLGAELKSLREWRWHMRRKADTIANALGERGLIDFADDVRMLTRL